jgi:hypothetical protein
VRPGISGRSRTAAGSVSSPSSTTATVVYALASVKRGTSHEEVVDLVEGFFTPSSTDAHNREIIISDYDQEPEVFESDIRQGG